MSIVIEQSGPLLTLQDRGRRGMRHVGLPSSGALDQFAYTVAQRLVGNRGNEATLEITAGSCVLRATTWCLIAVAGGDLQGRINDQPLPLWCACLIRPDTIISFGQRQRGARAYLALAGGFDVAPILGSRSTLLGGALPGVLGRVLRPSDELPFHTPQPLHLAGRCWPIAVRPTYAAIPTIRYLAGPHQHLFAADIHEQVRQTAWRISSASNRMGFRLTGAAIAAHIHSIASLGVVPGVIQVPPNGEPIILLADAQTTGGYPILGTVITADLPRLAQLLPNDSLYLQATTHDVAHHEFDSLITTLQHPLDADDEILDNF